MLNMYRHCAKKRISESVYFVKDFHKSMNNNTSHTASDNVIHFWENEDDIINCHRRLKEAIVSNDRELFYMEAYRKKKNLTPQELEEKKSSISEYLRATKRRLDSYIWLTEEGDYIKDIVFLQEYFEKLFEVFYTQNHLASIFSDKATFDKFLSLSEMYLYKNLGYKQKEILDKIYTQKGKVQDILENKTEN